MRHVFADHQWHPDGPDSAITSCQLHMRHFRDGDTIWIEPFRAKSFPVLQDLVVDRNALDRIIAAGGYISVRTGSAVDANTLPIGKDEADAAFDAAACIGCGACVAACPNASAMLFVSAKAAHLNYLPQGAPEKDRRVLAMVRQMDSEGFGNCTNHYECEAVCPKSISADMIAKLNRDYAVASAREAWPDGFQWRQKRFQRRSTRRRQMTLPDGRPVIRE